MYTPSLGEETSSSRNRLQRQGSIDRPVEPVSQYTQNERNLITRVLGRFRKRHRRPSDPKRKEKKLIHRVFDMIERGVRSEAGQRVIVSSVYFLGLLIAGSLGIPLIDFLALVFA
jgi:hypothetical protein